MLENKNSTINLMTITIYIFVICISEQLFIIYLKLECWKLLQWHKNFKFLYKFINFNLKQTVRVVNNILFFFKKKKKVKYLVKF